MLEAVTIITFIAKTSLPRSLPGPPRTNISICNHLVLSADVLQPDMRDEIPNQSDDEFNFIFKITLSLFYYNLQNLKLAVFPVFDPLGPFRCSWRLSLSGLIKSRKPIRGCPKLDTMYPLNNKINNISRIYSRILLFPKITRVNPVVYLTLTWYRMDCIWSLNKVFFWRCEIRLLSIY